MDPDEDYYGKNKSSEKNLLAILFNVKTYTPVLLFSNYVSRSSNYSIRAEGTVETFFEKRIGAFQLKYPFVMSYEDFDEISFRLTGKPRIHTELVDGFINKGFGNCLYAGGAVFDYHIRKKDYIESGVSSIADGVRKNYATKWWDKAIKHRIATTITKEIPSKKIFDLHSLMDHFPDQASQINAILNGIGYIERMTLYASITANLKYIANYASLENFILAGWIPVLVKQDRNVSSIHNLKKEDIEYTSLPILNHVKKENLSPMELVNFELFLKKMI